MERLARGARRLSPGGLMLSAAMNGFYGLKRLTGNAPATAAAVQEHIQHPGCQHSPQPVPVILENLYGAYAAR